ncbi:lamin tail domain-containing protein [Candidatus Parcubacteria bacterium]|nr:lamin tail domain-containing protein [Candidatus Parcubacteria bacterium]
MNKHISKMLCLLLILGLNWAGLSAVGDTFAYFNDIENAQENTLSAGTLDFRLTKQNAGGFVGMENDGEIFHTSVAIPEPGSMPMQYFVYSANATPVCSEFIVRVKENETEIFNGSLPDFLSATTTAFGTWKFEFDLPVGAPVSQEDLCQADIIFSAWREEIASPEESGFFDIETLSLNLKAKTIVLNEVLANPNPDYPYPANREFIELKNNGDAPVDAAGWKVSEISGVSEKKYTITTSGGSNSAVPYGGSTIIPAGGWLVLLLSDATVLNNNGDTIRLYDSGDNKLDEYSYEIAKYGMSDARYLDGIGAWVDPIPTPGGMNILEGENACAAPSAAQAETSTPDVDVIEEVLAQEVAKEENVEVEEQNFEEEPVVEEESVIEEENVEAPTLSDFPVGEAGAPTQEVVGEEQAAVEETPAVIEEEQPAAEEIFPVEIPATIEEEPEPEPRPEEEETSTPDIDASENNE